MLSGNNALPSLFISQRPDTCMIVGLNSKLQNQSYCGNFNQTQSSAINKL